jgi:hypothetical protein
VHDGRAPGQRPLSAAPALTVRPATADDADAVAAVYVEASLRGSAFVGDPPPDAAAFRLMLQTGHAFFVAEAEGRPCGVVRHHEDEGIALFDLLASIRPPAGRRLIQAVEHSAQDRGLRLARCRVWDEYPFAEYFQRRGYLPISRERSEGPEGPIPVLVLERRLPLLTVREQRREDARSIEALTGADPWVFEQGARPGWFLASDGDRVVGVVSVQDAGQGLARVSTPVLLSAYRGRRLELWMLDRAATYAETNGYHSAELGSDDHLDALRRLLEERRWFQASPGEGPYVRRFRDLPTPGEHSEDDWD